LIERKIRQEAKYNLIFAKRSKTIFMKYNDLYNSLCIFISLIILISMNDFWNNISRYPRFFISSLAGLILVILTPIRNLFKVKKFRFLIPVGLLFFILSLYFILRTMTGL